MQKEIFSSVTRKNIKNLVNLQTFFHNTCTLLIDKFTKSLGNDFLQKMQRNGYKKKEKLKKKL